MRQYALVSALAIGLFASASSLNSAPPGTQIVDSTGTVVGYEYGGSFERQVEGNWYYISDGVAIDGLVSTNSLGSVRNDAGTALYVHRLFGDSLPADVWSTAAHGILYK